MAQRHVPILILSAIIATSLMGCGRADGDPASGGLTVGESDRIEQAAARLDDRAPSPGQPDSAALEREVRQRLDQENGAISAR